MAAMNSSMISLAATKLLCPISRKILARDGLYDFSYKLNISHKYRYVYVDNPKTGCSSLKSALIEMEQNGHQSNGGIIDYKIIHSSNSPLNAVAPLYPNKTLTRLKSLNYTFFTFVRNPYTRLLSCYLNKFVVKESPVAGIFYKTFGTLPENFQHFVQLIATQADHEMNPHWRVQSSQIHYDAIPYSFIGRFENYDSDFNAVFQHLGIPQDSVPRRRHLNQTSGEINSLANCNRRTAKLIYDRFKVDFVNFAYPEDHSIISSDDAD